MKNLSINKNNAEEIQKEIIDYEDRVYKKYKKEIKEYFSLFYKRGCELRVGREWFNEKKKTHSKKRLEIEDGYRYRIYCIVEKYGEIVEYDDEGCVCDLKIEEIFTTVNRKFFKLNAFIGSEEELVDKTKMKEFLDKLDIIFPKEERVYEVDGKTIVYSEIDETLKIDGRLVHRCDVYNLKGKHRVRFTFVSSNGVDEQLIILTMDKNFDGEISWNGQKFKVPKCAFPSLDLYEKHMGKEFILDIDLKNDNLYIYNGVVEDGYVRYCSGNKEGMYIDEITPNKKRYICNSPISKDYEYDDLIFEVEILD